MSSPISLAFKEVSVDLMLKLRPFLPDFGDASKQLPPLFALGQTRGSVRGVHMHVQGAERVDLRK
eukprot:1161343-Pelagomonas_calceolata.AAC.3